MAWKNLRGELEGLFGELAGTAEHMAEALFQKATRDAARMAVWRKENPERDKEHRRRYKQGEAGKATQKRYLASPKGKEMARAKRARYRAKQRALRG